MTRRIEAMDVTFKALETAEDALRPIDAPDIYIANKGETLQFREAHEKAWQAIGEMKNLLRRQPYGFLSTEF